MARFILLDIEGTTTDIDFVHQVLFPYSAERLADYVRTHQQDELVQGVLQSVRDTIFKEENRTLDDVQQVIEVLLNWIREDRKHTALKGLQGLIWKQGYVQSDYKGHIYDDVPIALENWKQQNIRLGIYSSGSVQAQKLLFGHSIFGDLTPYFSHYFDTTVGGKKEPDSYRQIAQELRIEPSDILFLSDMEPELDAAAEAGLQVIQLVRKELAHSPKYTAVSTFADINLSQTSMVC